MAGPFSEASDQLFANAPPDLEMAQGGCPGDGILTVSERGIGQSSVNVFNLWAERWRHREGRGHRDYRAIRHNLIIGFDHEKDARRFWEAMRDRLQEFSLSFHPEKTRLSEFGRFAADRRAQRGSENRKLSTFSALPSSVEPAAGADS